MIMDISNIFLKYNVTKIKLCVRVFIVHTYLN
jgi:hypothetical protein